MKSIKSTLTLISLLATLSAFGADAKNAQIKVKDTFNLAPSGSVDMRGVIGDSLNTSLKGDILVWDIDDLVRPFKESKEEKLWQIEFWGKWYTSAELAYDFSPSSALDKRLKYAADELIKTQDKEGAITTYHKKHEFKFNETGMTGNFHGSWDMWGRKYVLLGLLMEYNRTNDAKILDAAKKHADYILKHVGDGKREIVQIGCWEGLASSSILEPMALLYRASGDKRYLDFCEWVIKTWQTNPVKTDLLNKALKNMAVYDMFEKAKPNPQTYMDYGKSKAYEMMSCFEGITELYRITGNPNYKKAVENVISKIREREITVLGSAAMHERWNDGAFEQQRISPYWMETCVTATWIKFAAQLLRLTGDVAFANDIELSAYNTMIAAQKCDGTWWAHYNTMSGSRTAAPEQCKMHMNCCVASGPRGLFVLPKVAYMTSDDGIVVNFFENGGASLPLPKTSGNVERGKVDIALSAPDFVRNNTAVLTIGGLKNGAQKFELKIRIPEWSKNTFVVVAGQKIDTPTAGKYLTLNHNFKNGDEIYLNFDADTKVVRDPQNPKFFVLKRGPYVLAQDKRFTKNFDSPAKVKITDGKVNALTSYQKGANVAVDVEMQDGSFRRFIDYASAGSTWDRDSEFKIWLQD